MGSPYVVCMAQEVELFTTREAGRKLGVSDETVRRWCFKGQIPAISLPGGHWRIRADVLDELLAKGAPAEVAA